MCLYPPHRSLRRNDVCIENRAFAAYWSALRDFMRGCLPRCDLDEAVIASLGEENVHLHNEFVLCLVNNTRCRHLPAELISQVPASCRGKVRHATIDDDVHAPPPLSTTTNASSSLPFQGKRKEGFLLDSGCVSSSSCSEAAAAAAGRRSSSLVRPTQATDTGRWPGSASSMSAGVRLEGGGGGGTGSCPPPKTVFLKMEGGNGIATTMAGGQRSEAAEEEEEEEEGQPGSTLRPTAAAGGAAIKLEERRQILGGGGVSVSSRKAAALGGGAACNGRSAVGNALPRFDDVVSLTPEVRRRTGSTSTTTTAGGTTVAGGVIRSRGMLINGAVSSDQLLDEIDSQFGAGAELYHPWAVGVGGGGGEGSRRKRPALSDAMPGDGTPRNVKAAKVKDGAAAGAGFANGNSGKSRVLVFG